MSEQTRAAADAGHPSEGPAAITYRVVQEALTNVARHSPTASVSVRVTENGEEIHVQVGDNGAGFEPASGSAGFGLAGLTERVRSAGGHLTAGPRPSGGFEVSAMIPSHLEAPTQPGTVPIAPSAAFGRDDADIVEQHVDRMETL